MDLSDEILIPASRDKVYAALNDPEVLKACIPGCETLEATSDDSFAAKVTLKVGPVKASFTGDVTLDRSGAPEKFSLTGQGSGGVAGFAKGGADVALTEEADGTLLVYTAKAEVGGRLAQLGNRLIVSTSKKLAGKFFENFRDEVAD